MKKNYIAPCMELETISNDCIVCGSPQTDGDNIITDKDNLADDSEDLAKSRGFVDESGDEDIW